MAGNTTRSRIRLRIEHIFGIQKQRAGNLLVYAIGLIRVQAKIGLRNLAYKGERVKWSRANILPGWACFWQPAPEVRPDDTNRVPKGHRILQKAAKTKIKPK